MVELQIDAVVLAAGRSSRMGRDKALLPAPEGGLMWERQRDVLRKAGARSIYLSARPEQAWVREVKGFAAVLHDALPGCGPLVGITAALERAVAATHVAVLAIDLPRMEGEWLERLRATCTPGVGAVGRRGAFFEPLAAIYPRAMMWPAWEALARGEYALQPWVGGGRDAGMLRSVEIAAEEAARFENWNEPR